MKNNKYTQALSKIKPEDDFARKTMEKLKPEEKRRDGHVLIPVGAFIACALAFVLMVTGVIPLGGRNGGGPQSAQTTPFPSGSAQVASALTPEPTLDPTPEPTLNPTPEPEAIATSMPLPQPTELISLASLFSNAKTSADSDAVLEMDEPMEGLYAMEAEYGWIEYDTNQFAPISESGFKSVYTSPLSTFAADVDTAGYTTLRRNLLEGRQPDSQSVRIEEMLNYFRYRNLAPEDDSPLKISTALVPCPWNSEHAIMFVGIGAREIETDELPPSNIVFLVDTSGSMDGADRLGLVKQAFNLYTQNLRAQDTISIVTYASSDRVVIEGVSGSERGQIMNAVDEMTAWGSTNGSAGIITAYSLAEKYFIEGGNNRVILMTDGDLNVGTTTESALKELIEEKRDSGVYLSVMGFGYGNYKDYKLETLADNGNGNYTYIDSLYQAKRTLVTEMGANFFTVCKDVKIQVEFNPEFVSSYRLIGYENRALAAEDFADDTKDGGEMGSGHTVVALYELIPAEGAAVAGVVGTQADEGATSLKYQTSAPTGSSEAATVSVRAKAPDGDTSELYAQSVLPDDTAQGAMLDNVNLACGVTEFGMLLRNSEHKGSSTYESAQALIDAVSVKDDDITELMYLITQAKRLCE
ncbi:MAG: von Willebrand factor type A domain-containing protein [Clostridia bacterium]|nr:von Willebrand factor type A domain-containing protein [Clostridia bacterium]